jgi:hypothetical protein
MATAVTVAQPRFIWIIRSWCSLDSFWEHVREHKEYDVAYTSVDMVLEEIQRIVQKQKVEWAQLCDTTTGSNEDDRKFDITVPSIDQIKSRPFIKFLSVISLKDEDDYMTSWYVERLQVAI